MNTRNLFAYAMVILIPLLPVVVLYIVFDGLNYFNFEDNLKGIVATGPIAAYFALLPIVWGIFKKMYPDLSVMSKKAKKLIGNWEVVSTSSNNHTYEGAVKISFKDYRLKISGQFKNNGVIVALFDTIVIKIDDVTMHMIYQIDDTNDSNRSKHYKGYCVLYIDTDKNEMTGQWALVNEPNNGTIKFKKVK